MRGLRSFLGLLVILIALGAYLYFVESRREAGGGSTLEKVFGVEADSIDEIRIRSESGDTTALRKTDGTWQIVEPSAIEPDSVEISGLTTNLSTLEVQRVIDENPANLAEYGLATPRVEVKFRSGGQERTLQVGHKTPPGTDLYAKLGDQPRVFLISSYLDSTFNRSTFDLRDKTVLKLERDKIDAVTITTEGRTMRFGKPAGEWRLSAPIEGRADFTAVDGLVSRLNTLQMRSIAAPDAARPAEYGLDKPAAVIQIGSGSSHATLLVGKSAGEGVVFARDQSRPAVVTIDDSLLDELKKDPAEFRQKDLFDARAFNATGLEVTRRDQTIAFEKAKVKNKEGQEEEQWRQTAPAAQEVDQTRIDNLLSAATQTRAEGFVGPAARTGLDSPEIIVVVKSGESRQETVRFGRSGTDAFAARAGEPGAAKIGVSALDNILKALDALQQEPAGTPDPQQKPPDKE